MPPQIETYQEQRNVGVSDVVLERSKTSGSAWETEGEPANGGSPPGLFDVLDFDNNAGGLNISNLGIPSPGSQEAATAKYVDDAITSAGSQTLLSHTTNLSSAQILALHDTPVETIPAPGVGKYILVGCISAKLTFGTTPYTIASNGQPYSGYEGQAQSDVFNGGMAPTTITSASDHIDADFGGWSVFFARTVVENKAIQFFVKDANPVGGDGTLQITYWYVVDDLP